MTLRLTPEMTAALRSGQYPFAPLIEIKLPDWTLRQLVGSGEVPWNGETFVGRDARFGVLRSAGTLRDGVANEAPDWTLEFAPPNNTAISILTSAAAQGAEVNGWAGLINRATGQLVPDPVRIFSGEIDVPQLRVGKAVRSITFRCVSALEVFHDDERGARLSDAWHKAIFPGETGLANMSGIEKTSHWGDENGPSGVTYVGGGGGGGFGGVNLNEMMR
jgi:hypothetical protein